MKNKEKTFPRMMRVRDNVAYKWEERLVVSVIPGENGVVALEPEDAHLVMEGEMELSDCTANFWKYSEEILDNVELPIINGYTGIMNLDKNIAVYGCTNIQLVGLRSIFKDILLYNEFKLADSCRKIRAIQLNSGVCINITQLRKLITAMNAAK